jgi:hypothetical protein
MGAAAVYCAVCPAPLRAAAIGLTVGPARYAHHVHSLEPGMRRPQLGVPRVTGGGAASGGVTGGGAASGDAGSTPVLQKSGGGCASAAASAGPMLRFLELCASRDEGLKSVG